MQIFGPLRHPLEHPHPLARPLPESTTKPAFHAPPLPYLSLFIRNKKNMVKEKQSVEGGFYRSRWDCARLFSAREFTRILKHAAKTFLAVERIECGNILLCKLHLGSREIFR